MADLEKLEKEAPTNGMYLGNMNITEECMWMLEHLLPYVAAGRGISPTYVFYRGDEKAISVMCRSSDDSDASDTAKAQHEPLLLWPSIDASAVMFGYENMVMVSGRGLTRCLVVSIASTMGMVSHAYPITEDETTGEPNFESDVDVEGGLEPTNVQHMFYTFKHVHVPPQAPSRVISWLSSLGHEVVLFDGWTMENIDPRTGN